MNVDLNVLEVLSAQLLHSCDRNRDRCPLSLASVPMYCRPLAPLKPTTWTSASKRHQPKLPAIGELGAKIKHEDRCIERCEELATTYSRKRIASLDDIVQSDTTGHPAR
jgi:hypothetical protein